MDRLPNPGAPGGAAPGRYGEALRREVAAAREELEAVGCQVAVKEIAGLIPEVTKDYGLAAVSLERAVKKDSPQLQRLSQVKVPLMVVLR